MAKSSIHIQAVKGGSQQHNEREKELDYVRKDLTEKNEVWKRDTIENRLGRVKQNYTHTTGQQLQKKATPIREGVFLFEQGTTMANVKELASKLEERFKIRTFQIYLHRDEGHWKEGKWKENLHGHMLFDWTDPNGKTIKLNRRDMSEMQTIVADTLGMERGKSSDKKHLTAEQFKTEALLQELGHQKVEARAAFVQEKKKFLEEQQKSRAILSPSKRLSLLPEPKTLETAKGFSKRTEKALGSLISRHNLVAENFAKIGKYDQLEEIVVEVVRERSLGPISQGRPDLVEKANQLDRIEKQQKAEKEIRR